MECRKNKNKKHKYSNIDMDYHYDISMKELEKQGNKSISGLMHKCVAVKRRGCIK